MLLLIASYKDTKPFLFFLEDEQVEDEASLTTNDQQQEEEFTFQLFSSKPVAKVNISEKDNEAERLKELIASAAQQRSVDHDMESDADFIAQINQAAISFDDIMTQSQWAYPALRLPHRVIPAGSSSSSPTTTTEKSKPRRKSKKRRDFEKAVRQGRIVVSPNMRDPQTPGGWPGWPGNRTRYAIITNIEKDLKVNKKAGNTSFKRGGGRGGATATRGRGSGRGGMMRGRGRGR